MYGLVITAQIIASYASLIVDFEFKRVSAKHVSMYRTNKEKLSEILSSVIEVRIMWLVSLTVYLAVVHLVPLYRKHSILFLFAFGCTFNELLFPQFFFQGIEKWGISP